MSSCTKSKVDVNDGDNHDDQLRTSSPSSVMSLSTSFKTRCTTVDTDTRSNLPISKKMELSKDNNNPLLLPYDVMCRIVSFSHLSTLVTFRQVNFSMKHVFEKELFHRMEHKNKITEATNTSSNSSSSNDNNNSDENNKQTSMKVQINDPSYYITSYSIEMRMVDDWSEEYASKSNLVEYALQKYCNPQMKYPYEDYADYFTYEYDEELARASLLGNHGVVYMCEFVSDYELAEKNYPQDWFVSVSCPENDCTYIDRHLRDISTKKATRGNVEQDSFRLCLAFLFSKYRIKDDKYNINTITQNLHTQDLSKGTMKTDYTREKCLQCQLRIPNGSEQQVAASSTTSPTATTWKRIEIIVTENYSV